MGYVIIRLEARLQPNTGNTFLPVLMVLTHSSITPRKVNRFGWNLEHSVYILWGWPGQILSTIRIVARAVQTGKLTAWQITLMEWRSWLCPWHTLQKPAPENWRRFLAAVFHASCKISGARNQHGRIKSNHTFYLPIRPTHVKQTE